MKTIKFLLLTKLLTLVFCLSENLNACNVSLDLEGNGQITQIKLPYPYFSKEDKDHFTLVTQGGYKIYDLSQVDEVAVIGPLQPCIGIAVTDSVKLLVFHRHLSNSFKSLRKIIEDNLDRSDKSKVYAKIYSTDNDLVWSQSKTPGCSTHREEVLGVKNFLDKEMGITRENISANIWQVWDSEKQRYTFPDYELKRYEASEIYIAVRMNNVFQQVSNTQKQIKFYSIDHFSEDIFGYKGIEISLKEYFGSNFEMVQKTYPGINFEEQKILYDDIPRKYKEASGEDDGYKVQRGICDRRVKHEEDNYYRTFFKKTYSELHSQRLMVYNSLSYYPVD